MRHVLRALLACSVAPVANARQATVSIPSTSRGVDVYLASAHAKTQEGTQCRRTQRPEAHFGGSTAGTQVRRIV